MVAVAATAVVVGGAVLLPGNDGPVHGTDPARPAAQAVDVPQSQPSSAPGQPIREKPFDTTAHSTTDPSSIWVVVNKTHPITPSDFRPRLGIVRGYQVATAAVEPLTRLLDAGDRRGLGLKVESAFRSYGYQQQVHAATVANRGEAEADLLSARAGYSEHQTGLAVDLITPGDPGCDFEACFADGPAGRWLAHQAWRWGFQVRYQPATTDITGYQPEPWHLRYVGRPLAAQMHRTGVRTLEELFGVPGGDYPG